MPQPHRATLAGRALTTARLVPGIDVAGIGRDEEDLSWQQHAACRHADPDLFFPEPGDGFEQRQAAAKQVCGACPVADACRAHARARFERHGVWGGQAPCQRPRRPRSHGPASRHERDAEIVRLTRAGLTARQVADALGCTRRTVGRGLARHRDTTGRAAA